MTVLLTLRRRHSESYDDDAREEKSGYDPYCMWSKCQNSLSMAAEYDLGIRCPFKLSGRAYRHAEKGWQTL